MAKQSPASASLRLFKAESGINGNLPQKKKTAEIQKFRRCVLSKPGPWPAGVLLRGFLSGFFLHASFYLGFVRLSSCLPFFLLVGS